MSTLRRVRAVAASVTVALIVAVAPSADATNGAKPVLDVDWSFARAAVVVPKTTMRVTASVTWPDTPSTDADSFDVTIQVNNNRTVNTTLTTQKTSRTVKLGTAKPGARTVRVTIRDPRTGEAVLTQTRSYTVRRAATSLTAKWPKKTTKVGKRRVIKGRVKSSDKKRKIVLQHRGHDGWRTIVKKKTNARGVYRLRIPTHYFAKHRLRVRVPATTTAKAAATKQRRLTVRPKYKPLGKKSSYTLSKWRWDPCQTIRYRINPARAPRNGVADAKKAVRMVARATGLNFVYAGTTKTIPWDGYGSPRGVRSPSLYNADMIIGWATPKQVPALAGDVAGLGGTSRGLGYDSKGWVRAIDAQIVLDSTHPWRPGFGAGQTHGEVLLHELGHGVGLKHYFADKRQIMSYGTADIDRFGAGDIEGLRRVGASAGCFANPVPYARQAALVGQPQATRIQ